MVDKVKYYTGFPLDTNPWYIDRVIKIKLKKETEIKPVKTLSKTSYTRDSTKRLIDIII